MSKFKKGDRVRLIAHSACSIPVGLTGTVAEDSICPYVIWDDWKSREGDARWCIYETRLELIPPESPAKITMDGEYVYREVGKARILCVDAPGDFPVVSVNENGLPYIHTEFGEYYIAGESQFDLLPAPKMIEVDAWLVYGGDGGYHSQFYRHAAAEKYMQKHARKGCVIHVKISVPPGHIDQE